MASLVETEYGIQKIFHDAEDFLPLLGTDFVEFYVGDAKQTAHYYKTAFGFHPMHTLVLKQDKKTLLHM